MEHMLTIKWETARLKFELKAVAGEIGKVILKRHLPRSVANKSMREGSTYRMVHHTTMVSSQWFSILTQRQLQSTQTGIFDSTRRGSPRPWGASFPTVLRVDSSIAFGGMSALTKTARSMTAIPLNCVAPGIKPSTTRFRTRTITGLAEHMTFTKLVIGYASASFIAKIPIDWNNIWGSNISESSELPGTIHRSQWSLRLFQ